MRMASQVSSNLDDIAAETMADVDWGSNPKLSDEVYFIKAMEGGQDQRAQTLGSCPDTIIE